MKISWERWCPMVLRWFYGNFVTLQCAGLTGIKWWFNEIDVQLSWCVLKLQWVWFMILITIVVIGVINQIWLAGPHCGCGLLTNHLWLECTEILNLVEGVGNVLVKGGTLWPIQDPSESGEWNLIGFWAQHGYGYTWSGYKVVPHNTNISPYHHRVYDRYIEVVHGVKSPEIDQTARTRL